MRIYVTWFATGNTTAFEENDKIIGPQSTILEVKGLIQIRFGFKSAYTVMMFNGHVLDDMQTLRSLGIVDEAASEANPLMAHAFSENELDDDDKTSTEGDTKIHEFSHDDFLKVCSMLGKVSGVSEDRIKEVRSTGAPLTRPRFLDKPEEPSTAGPGGAAAPGGQGVIPPGSLPVMKILKNLMHGPRFPTVELDYALHYPGVTEPYGFWDLRCAEDHIPQTDVHEGEIMLELFFFGEIGPTQDEPFRALVQNLLQRNGYRARLPIAYREAGCMYPLIAVPVIMSEVEARTLGEAIFEGFGRMTGLSEMDAAKGERDPSIAKQGADPNCSIQ